MNSPIIKKTNNSYFFNFPWQSKLVWVTAFVYKDVRSQNITYVTPVKGTTIQSI